MALQTVLSAPVPGLRYDPDHIDQSTLAALFAEPEEEPVLMGAEDEAADPLASILIAEDAPAANLARLKTEMTTQGFLADEIAEMEAEAGESVDLEALFAEVEQEIEAGEDAFHISEEALKTCDENMASLQLSRADGQTELRFEGKVILEFDNTTLLGASADSFLSLVVLVIDSIFFAFALINVGMKADSRFKNWVTKHMNAERKKWLKFGKETLKHMKKAIKEYKASRKKGDSKLTAMRKAKKVMAKGFKAVLKFLFGNMLNYTKQIVKAYFGDVKRAAKTVLQLLVKLAVWMGTAGWLLVKAIADAAIQGITVLQDVDQYRADVAAG
ncbi:MAG: hypothetical protein GY947_11635 [Rhodobacteraceae bacterium]|nr:hypothetical protein [Paracoccaceae bacterium]